MKTLIGCFFSGLVISILLMFMGVYSFNAELAIAVAASLPFAHLLFTSKESPSGL